MKIILRAIQILAIIIAVCSGYAVIEQRSLFPLIFAIGSWIMAKGLAEEIKILSK